MHNNQSINRARSLRTNQTTAESILWKHLRGRQLSVNKWRRQHPIDNFIVDFYCSELKLVIEVDGDVHAFSTDRDAQRQAYLESQGLTVIRFTNDDIINNLDGVLTKLWEVGK